MTPTLELVESPAGTASVTQEPDRRPVETLPATLPSTRLTEDLLRILFVAPTSLVGDPYTARRHRQDRIRRLLAEWAQDDPAEQRRTLDDLRRSLDANRSARRPLFPER